MTNGAAIPPAPLEPERVPIATASAAATAQASGLTALAVRGHPNVSYNTVFELVGTHAGWPHYQATNNELHLFRHAESARWVFSFTTTERELDGQEGPATIHAPEGPVPVGEHVWRRRGKDAAISVDVLATAQEVEAWQTTQQEKARSVSREQFVDARAVCVEGECVLHSDVYFAAGEHEGWLHFESAEGTHLYRYQQYSKWFISSKFDPNSNICLAHITDETGLLPVGEHEWRVWVSRKWQLQPLTVSLLHSEAEVCEQMERLLAKKAAHAMQLVVGAAVTWFNADDDIPHGSVGEIVGIEDDGDARVVRFTTGRRWTIRSEELILATPEQAAQWKAMKPELDAKEAAHAAALVVGTVATWIGSNGNVPAGTLGEIFEILEDGFRGVRFPAIRMHIRPERLVPATPEQAAQWKALKPGLDAKEAAHAAMLVVGAVVTPTENMIRGGAVGEIQALGKSIIYVRFPEGLRSCRPENLVLATPEQVAQWKAMKPELDAKDVAHAATLAVGAVVTCKTQAFINVFGNAVGEIIQIIDDGRGRRVRFSGQSTTFLPGQLVLATARQVAEWKVIKAELEKMLIPQSHVEPGSLPEPEPEPEPQPQMEPQKPEKPQPESEPMPSAAKFCGPGTGISTAGIRHCIRRFGLADAALQPQPLETEFIVDTSSWSADEPPRLAYWQDSYMANRVEMSAENGARVQVSVQTEKMVQVAGGWWLPKLFLRPVTTARTTTSDLCHAYIKPATVPHGWIDEPELLLVDDDGNDISSRCWYKHVYRKQGASDTQSMPPPSTCSMCAALAAHPETACFVGKPTHFLSHAWLYKILNVVGALEEFEASQPAGSPPVYWWFDCFAIDQHTTQALSQEWWSTTFKKAIAMMGHTVMLLSPWDAPQPLERAWCLWELHCTVETEQEFSILLGPVEKAAFRAALKDDSGKSAIAALSTIDVRKSQSGKAEDLLMILGAVNATDGGAEALNERAVGQLRERFVGAQAREWVSSLRSANGSLDTKEARSAGFSVGLLLGHELGHWEEARELWELVVAGYERVGDYVFALRAQLNLASAMAHTNQVAEARVLYEQILPKQIETFGLGDSMTLEALGNLAAILSQLGDFHEALEKADLVVDGFTKLYGADSDKTLVARSLRANTYAKLSDIEPWRLDEAKTEFEAVIAKRRATLGSRHPDVLGAQYSLAILFHDELGHKEEGLHLLQDAVEVWRTVLGGAHDHTQKAARLLASWERAADPNFHEHVATLAVGAVVTLEVAQVGITAGTVGQILSVTDRDAEYMSFWDSQKGPRKRVWFPGGRTGNIKPEHLMLATPEQVAQWEATKAEGEAKDAARRAALDIGAIVSCKSHVIIAMVKTGSSTAIGEITKITHDGSRHVEFLQPGFGRETGTLHVVHLPVPATHGTGNA